MRSGSQERSLPALQRLCAPGMRALRAPACAQARQGCLSRACLRTGASSFTSCWRIAMVKDEVTPTCCSAPRSSYRPSSSEPTAGEEVEGHEARGRLLRELRHARGGGVQPHLQRVEVETARGRDHDLAIDHTAFRQLFEQRVVQFREIAVEGFRSRLWM